MEPNGKVPSLEEIKSFLEEYGWHFKESTSENRTYLIAPYTLEKENKGILVSFRVEGEFVMVSTVDFLKNVPGGFTKNLLSLNDRIKLVKLFTVGQNNDDTFNIDLGFELWSGSWSKEAFFSFMDMLCLGIEKTIKTAATENIPHQTSFITFS